MEKAGVIKPGSFCVLAANPPVVRDLVEGACRAAGADFVWAPEGVGVVAEMIGGRTRLQLRTALADYGAVTLSLRGRHQIDNAVTAVRVLEELARRDLARVPARAVRAALEDVEWPGRLELRRRQGRDVLIDGAHNPAGAHALCAFLQEAYGGRLPIVVGAMREKNIRRMLEELAPTASCFVCTAPRSPRAVPADTLAAIAREVAPSIDVMEVTPAIAALDRAAARGEPAVVAGSAVSGRRDSGGTLVIPFSITHGSTRNLRPPSSTMCRPIVLLFVGFAIGVLWPEAARAQGNPLASCKYSLVEREQFSYPLVAGSDTVHEGRLSGRVRIICDDLTLQAEEIHWREDSDMIYASGDVFFQQLGTQISAETAEMDRRTHLGTFHQASGWLELQAQTPDLTLFGTQEPYAVFQGEELEKIGDKLYKLTRGSFTTCRQPTPRWEMTASTVILATGRHATLKNMVLRVKDVPIFYLPALYYPINKEDRATGFLLPNYGVSSVKGFTLNNAFFWAVNRSQDATFYYDYFAKAGQGSGGEYRYVREAGSQGNGRIYMLNEHEQLGDDGTVVRPAHRSFDMRGSMNQALTQTMRMTGHINYFTDISTQQIYQQNIYDLSLRTRSYGASVSAGTGRYRFSGQYDKTDVFTGTSASRVGEGPFGNFSIAEKPIGQSLVYFGATANGGYLIRQDDIDNPLTNRGLWRFDTLPRVSLPISNLSALTVTTSAAWRYTFWTASLDPTIGRVPDAISRQVVQLQTRIVGPVFSRIWHTPDNHYADGFKHLIEPSLTVDRLSAFKDAGKIVQLDGTDTLVTGTTTVTYGLTNRVLAKRRTGAAPGVAGQAGSVREILTVAITQTYYTNSLAAKYDPQYQSSYAGLYSYTPPASPFSPILVSATTRPSDTTSAQFRMEYDAKYNAVRTYNAAGTISEPRAEITAGWSKREVIPGLEGFSDPQNADHFLNAHITLKRPDHHFGGTYAFNYDVLRGYFLQRRYQIFYNTQCCGLAFDYQTVDLSHVSGSSYPGNDRRMSIAFTLAGIGTFSNPLGSFGSGSGSR